MIGPPPGGARDDAGDSATAVRPGLAASLTVAAVIVVVLAASGVPSPLYALYDRRWGLGTTGSSLVFAAYSIGVVLLLALGPPVVRRVGLRGTLALGLVAVVLADAVFVGADQVPAWHSTVPLVVGRVLQGMATGLVNSAGGAALAALSGTSERSAATAGAAVPTGVALGAVLAGLLAGRASAALTTPYLAVTVLALVLLAGVTRLPALGCGPPRPVSPGPPARTGGRSPVLIAAPLAVLTWAAGGVYLALGGTLVGHLAPADGPVLGGLVVLLVQGAGGLTQVVVRARDARRVGIAAALVLLLGAVCATVGTAVGSVPLFLSAALLTGIGFGLGFSGSIRTAGRQATPAALSRYFLVSYAAMSVAAIGAGALLESRGPTLTLVWCTAATAMLTLPTVLAGRRAGL